MYNIDHTNLFSDGFIIKGSIIIHVWVCVKVESIVLILTLYFRRAVPLQEALTELNEDPPEDSGSDSSDIEDLR